MSVFHRMHKSRSRQGVSLLEVVVAIGVTSIGLLGVIALIPLGGVQARQGQIYERSAVVANAALGEVRARDMVSPANWVYAAGGAVTVPAYPLTSYCIDPRTVASGVATNFPSGATAKMERVNLYNGAGAAMSLPMANAIFQSQDDLSLNALESDRSMPATQVWNRTKITTDPAKRRQYEGTMSWMMTVQPNYAKGSPNDVCTVSIVVFNRRILGEEFTANVSSMPGGGVAGGDIIIDFAGMSYSDDQLKTIKTPQNSWLLLSGRKQIGDPMNPIFLSLFQWYRILGSETNPSNLNVRDITLAGPDWDVTMTNIQATIIPGTVTVYQENMQLEATSLWRN